ncbi:MAG: valine--tRNA ligase [Nitrososphaeraceae archaeon]|nr:valine--tRNA ligase [Nitrososphaeraceae archaeon]
MEPKITSKSWNHKLESIILESWDNEEIYNFTFDKNNDAQNIFVIDTPPPYPSGRPWHIGAAAHYAQIDMIARTARMYGNRVLFPIGIDRNGLPVEIYTEKKHKIRMKQMEREKFLDLCKSALDDLESEMISIMKNLGISANFKEYYRTDSIEFRSLTQKTFIDLWKKGLIYISNRPNNYCIDCGTTIADAEIIYDDILTNLVYMKFKIENTNDKILIASTRPELLFACQAVIVNPKDDRFFGIHGKRAILPLFGRSVPIMTHHSAKPEFGTGALMVCSYGDQNDVQVFRDLKLEEIVSVDQNGRITKEAGKYQNQKIKQAQENIINDLKQDGFVEKIEKVIHRTPICERSKTPIEIIPLQDYYLKQVEFVPIIKDISKNICFYPEVHKQILDNWLNTISIDWPISRRRFYGTEVPVWFCNTCQEVNVPLPGKYYQPWKEKPPFRSCLKCGSNDFTGETKTFDTWMDSSITPLFISKYVSDPHFFKKIYPTTIRPQAKDIIRTWLYYSMLRCYQLTGSLPWTNAWIMGYGVDEKGKKMSKSKGNVIDPFPIIQQYGADTFRFWSASETNLGQDFRCSEQSIAISQKFLSKLWNIGRFLSSFSDSLTDLDRHEMNLLSTDKWILSELFKLVKNCLKGYDLYNFFIPSNQIRDFTWNIFAAHYIEMVKNRVYDNSNQQSHNSALYTLHQCFSTILLLLAPICPFITDTLWKELYSRKSIHLELKPMFTDQFKDFESYTQKIIDFNSYVWNRKKESINPHTGKKNSLKDPISISIPEELTEFKNDLVVMHNLIDSDIS